MKHTTRQRRKVVFDVAAELEELVSDPTLRPYNFLESSAPPSTPEPSTLTTSTPVTTTPEPTSSDRHVAGKLGWSTAAAILSSLPMLDGADRYKTGGVNGDDETLRFAIPSSRLPESALREISDPVTSTPVTATPDITPLETDSVEVAASDVGLGLSRRAHPLRIREARLVQDGHSASEQVVYDYLWKVGKMQNEQVRTIRTGVVSVAKNLGMSDSTVKAAVEGLLDKLAIERGSTFSWTLGYEYKILSWAACLAKRKAAGLTHVIKSKGVVFVHPTTGQQLTFSHFPGKRKGPSTLNATTLVSATAGATRDKFRKPSVLEHEESRVLKSTVVPLSDFAAQNKNITTTNVRDALSKYAQPDEIGIRALISAVQQNAPDATWEELAFFISQKGEIIKKNKINNPFGFLLVTVPRAFESPAFQSWRKSGGEAMAGIASRLQEASHTMQMLRQHCEAVLADSSSTAAQTTEAKSLLEALE